jgi:hypothetical protein
MFGRHTIPVQNPRASAACPPLCGQVVIAALMLLGATAIDAQSSEGPEALIRYLTYQADRPDKHGMVKGWSPAFSCGPFLSEARDNRALTQTLVNSGQSAVPALETALDSFEARGDKSDAAPEAGWLLLAYARLKGPAAYPRLSRMYGNPSLSHYSSAFDAALAFAFGLTSYLSGAQATETYRDHICVGPHAGSTLGPEPCTASQHEQPMKSFNCDRGNEPRDSLDRLILAWQAGNRVSVEASLGPAARSALQGALQHRSWGSLQRELGSSTPGQNAAMGYRLNVAGRWSEPGETLEQDRERTTIADTSTRFAINTQFFRGSGKVCGTLKLSFLAVPESGWLKNGDPLHPVPGPLEYLINNSDVLDLLRLVFDCVRN